MAERHDRQLLVEGNDDCHVLYALCEKFKLPETFDIIDCKGIGNLFKGLPTRIKSSGAINTIGIIIDADTDILARWETVRNILLSSGKYDNVPNICPEGGLILHPIIPEDITFGVWIMPDNKTNGMLENFTTYLIPNDDRLLQVVDETLDRIESEGLNRYELIHREKARIHSWLAWQETPGTPMGLAITKKYLSTEPPVCQAFVKWLNSLFNQECIK
ncbi:DUF3226 domain-containing protein [uncultured Duncaniella sp.]|uniref:DUF3226 domain-containing protein n=1 Tax=uncultured Duncaniella sp. TaxID=2768039 RepID=UPI0025DA6053|nr:DUF3226 domain-containing protein [uncultured Duncaniella sp.]